MGEIDASLYILYDPDKKLYYAGSRRGWPDWSSTPKTFTSLGHLRQSLYQSSRHITGRMVIYNCKLSVVDARYVTERDVNPRG